MSYGSCRSHSDITGSRVCRFCALIKNYFKKHTVCNDGPAIKRKLKKTRWVVGLLLFLSHSNVGCLFFFFFCITVPKSPQAKLQRSTPTSFCCCEIYQNWLQCVCFCHEKASSPKASATQSVGCQAKKLISARVLCVWRRLLLTLHRH